MSEREPHPHFPPLPEPWPRLPDVVPPAPPVDAGAAAVTAVRETDAPPAAALSPEAREQARVQLAGRVGRDPVFWLTRSNIPRAKFPLGVKEDPATDKTTWHEVHAWRRVAEQVRDTVKKGDAVEIVAYREEHEVAGSKHGRTVVQLRAVVVKRRG